MNDFEVERCARLAAKQAITEWLLLLGVDSSNPQEILAIQRDFATLRSIRESAELIHQKGLTAAVTVIVAGVLGVIWYFIRGH